MHYRQLGRTGIPVSAIAFGAGPVSGLMTGSEEATQCETVAAAIRAGINWFDTAPGYGNGLSESSLGAALCRLKPTSEIHLASKVRLPLDRTESIRDCIRRSVDDSLRRLQVSSITLLQLHNGITRSTGDEPASLSPREILGHDGVADTMDQLREAGLIRHLGLTGTGHPSAMKEVIRSNRFDTVQTPYNLLNPSAGPFGVMDSLDVDYGNILQDATETNMGVFAIRVFAAGALLNQPPSAHTLKTPYFPLALYERDLRRAEQLRTQLESRCHMMELAVRFALSNSVVSSAIIGFGSATQVSEVTDLWNNNPLPVELLALIQSSSTGSSLTS